MAMRRSFEKGRVKKFEKLLERAKKRGISRERLEERIKVFGGIVWLSKWRRMSFKEKVEFAKRRYGVKKISREVIEVLRELEKGKIGYKIIGRIEGKKFVVCLPWLYELSFSKNWGVREDVAYALGRIGIWNEDVKEVLEKLSGDGNVFIRGYAARALGWIGVWNKSVGEMLVRLSRDKDYFVRKGVAYALGRIGIWNEDVKLVLERLGRDKDWSVRNTLLRELENMRIDESVKERLRENIKLTNKIVKVAGRYFRELNYEKSYLVIEGLFRKRFDRERFLKDEKYREQLLNLVKAMSVEDLRRFVFGK